MSQLEKLTAHDVYVPKENFVVPGKWVKHVKDEESWGLCVGSWGDFAMTVLVLWSRQPKLLPDIKVQNIQGKSRKLNTKFSAGPTKFLLSHYAPGELEALAQEPGMKVTLYQPGSDGDSRVEVERSYPMRRSPWEDEQ